VCKIENKRLNERVNANAQGKQRNLFYSRQERGRGRERERVKERKMCVCVRACACERVSVCVRM
jgi:hypothetical protein